MDEPLDILLTNDDGIDAPGFRPLYDALSGVGNVFAVAPATNQSRAGRSMSTEVGVTEHELGYAIDGTPADCVVAGVEELGPYPDLVVSGPNKGANLGDYVLGRSGTVSAAVEASFFDVPAIAVSMYFAAETDAEFYSYEPTPDDFAEALRATTYLVRHAMGAGVFDRADYLNVNAPLPPEDGHAPMAITEPAHGYDMDARYDGKTVTLYDRIWTRMARGDAPDPEGTDRWAITQGMVSVSPLTAPHSAEHHEALDALATTYPDTG